MITRWEGTLMTHLAPREDAADDAPPVTTRPPRRRVESKGLLRVFVCIAVWMCTTPSFEVLFDVLAAWDNEPCLRRYLADLPLPAARGGAAARGASIVSSYGCPQYKARARARALGRRPPLCRSPGVWDCVTLRESPNAPPPSRPPLSFTWRTPLGVLPPFRRRARS